MDFWKQKKVLVTGGTGFIGSHLVEALLTRGAVIRVVGRRSATRWHSRREVVDSVEYVSGDLRDASVCGRTCEGCGIILHLAAVVGGIGYNFPHPATLFIENVLPGLQFLEAARKAQAERILLVSSACVYPRDARIPTLEEDGFRGDPEEGNLGYGWGKRSLEVYGRMMVREFGSQLVIARPYNAYGPRDDFSTATSHVIPALLRKALAPGDEMVVWGDGTPTRSFVYVADIVEGLLLAAERGPVGDPVNLGTEEEVSIGDLARRVLNACGVSKALRFDASKPGGQPRRTCDTSKAFRTIGYRAAVPLSEGLARTVKWLRENPAVLEEGR